MPILFHIFIFIESDPFKYPSRRGGQNMRWRYLPYDVRFSLTFHMFPIQKNQIDDECVWWRSWLFFGVALVRHSPLALYQKAFHSKRPRFSPSDSTAVNRANSHCLLTQQAQMAVTCLSFAVSWSRDRWKCFCRKNDCSRWRFQRYVFVVNWSWILCPTVKELSDDSRVQSQIWG